MSFDDISRGKVQQEPDAHVDDDHIIKLADHRNEIGNQIRIGGVVLIAAGIYQLSPLKRICLSNCRSPMSWLLNSWRNGTSGALLTGVKHEMYCLGCCWLLFVILFPLGMMNIAAMALIAALIFAEKSLPISGVAVKLASLGLIAYGAVVLAFPDVLPTTM